MSGQARPRDEDRVESWVQPLRHASQSFGRSMAGALLPSRGSQPGILTVLDPTSKQDTRSILIPDTQSKNIEMSRLRPATSFPRKRLLVSEGKWKMRMQYPLSSPERQDIPSRKTRRVVASIDSPQKEEMDPALTNSAANPNTSRPRATTKREGLGTAKSSFLASTRAVRSSQLSGYEAEEEGTPGDPHNMFEGWNQCTNLVPETDLDEVRHKPSGDSDSCAIPQTVLRDQKTFAMLPRRAMSIMERQHIDSIGYPQEETGAERSHGRDVSSSESKMSDYENDDGDLGGLSEHGGIYRGAVSKEWEGQRKRKRHQQSDRQIQQQPYQETTKKSCHDMTRTKTGWTRALRPRANNAIPPNHKYEEAKTLRGQPFPVRVPRSMKRDARSFESDNEQHFSKRAARRGPDYQDKTNRMRRTASSERVAMPTRGPDTSDSNNSSRLPDSQRHVHPKQKNHKTHASGLHVPIINSDHQHHSQHDNDNTPVLDLFASTQDATRTTPRRRGGGGGGGGGPDTDPNAHHRPIAPRREDARDAAATSDPSPRVSADDTLLVNDGWLGDGGVHGLWSCAELC